MSAKNSIPPYPFLYDGEDKSISPNDSYVESKFSMNLEIAADNPQVSAVLNLDEKSGNEVIKGLISKGKAGYQIRVESSEAFYREIFPPEGPSKSNRISFKLDTSIISRNLQITGFIIAREFIDYRNNDFNDFYRENTYHLEPGNIIAITDTRDFVIDTDVNDTAEGIIFVAPRDGDEKPEDEEKVTLNIEDSSINILLSRKYYKIYKDIGDAEFKHTIMSSMILPAFMEVLYAIRESPEMYEKYDWFQTVYDSIIERCPNFFDEDYTPDILSVAQKVFTGIVGKSMNELNSYMSYGGEE